jgi:signal transduction histidine kinase
MKQIILTIDAYLALTAALINLIFAILVIVRTSRTIVYKTFFFICISTAIWNLGDFMVFSTGDRFWFYFSLIGSGMIPAFMFHFIYTVVKPEQKSSLVTAVYIFSSLLALSSPFAMVDTRIQQFVDSFAWNICYLALLIPVFLWSIIMLFRAIQLASDEKKNILRYIFIATIIGVFTGITDLVQILEVSVPPLGHLGTVVYSSILAIGLFKYRMVYDIVVQMQKKMEVLNEMAVGIAHEIRNPLSSIKGASRILSQEMKNPDEPKRREYLNIITEETERLDNILANFQDFTRPLKIDRDLIPINEVIEKTVKLIEMGAYELRIRLDLCRDLPQIKADASFMKQVFLNLIKNAAEACGSSGKLIIKTECISPWVKISFSDNGPGIQKELINHIFEPFFSTKATGMGMGLATSMKVVKAHNGRIEAKNVLPQGTVFFILLPV